MVDEAERERRRKRAPIDARPSEHQEWGAAVGLPRERTAPPPGGVAWPLPRRRPVEVTQDNRPPGDPGPGVDVQELVGGQPGRPDPGPTGGPAHDAVGASDPHAPGERERAPAQDKYASRRR